MNIIKQTSIVHTSYYANRPLDYIAVHYTAGTTSRKGIARNVASMFANPNNRDASADFIVDDFEIVQYNGDIRNRYCYAVGGKKYTYSKGGTLYNICKNYNSISIEVCSSNKTGKVTNPNDNNWYFTDAVIKNTEMLVKYLMETYNIPASHVIRHWDVNGKPCPGIIGWNADSGDESKWIKFKNNISTVQPVMKKEDELDMTIDEFVNKLTNEQAYVLVQKAREYSDSLPESEWSVNEGAWKRATDNKIVNGNAPKSYITREEIIAVLDRKEH